MNLRQNYLLNPNQSNLLDAETNNKNKILIDQFVCKS